LPTNFVFVRSIGPTSKNPEAKAEQGSCDLNQ